MRRPSLFLLISRLPDVFIGLACAALVITVALVYARDQASAARLLALREGAPERVAIETFDPARDRGPTGEVRMLAQVDMTAPLRLRYREGLQARRAVVYRLLPLDTGGRTAAEVPALGLLYYAGRDEKVELFDPRAPLPEPLARGDNGPIVELNGELGAPAGLSRVIAQVPVLASATAGMRPVVLRAYPDGRTLGLTAPRGLPWHLVALAAAGVFAGLGLMLRKRYARLEEEQRHAALVAASVTNAYRRRTPPGVPSTQKARHRFAPLAGQEELMPRRDEVDTRMTGLKEKLVAFAPRKLIVPPPSERNLER